MKRRQLPSACCRVPPALPRLSSARRHQIPAKLRRWRSIAGFRDAVALKSPVSTFIKVGPVAGVGVLSLRVAAGACRALCIPNRGLVSSGRKPGKSSTGTGAPLGRQPTDHRQPHCGRLNRPGGLLLGVTIAPGWICVCVRPDAAQHPCYVALARVAGPKPPPAQCLHSTIGLSACTVLPQ